jgi:hypothetical protein
LHVRYDLHFQQNGCTCPETLVFIYLNEIVNRAIGGLLTVHMGRSNNYVIFPYIWKYSPYGLPLVLLAGRVGDVFIDRRLSLLILFIIFYSISINLNTHVDKKYSDARLFSYQ